MLDTDLRSRSLRTCVPFAFLTAFMGDTVTESSSIARLMEEAAPGSIGACAAKTAEAVKAEGVDEAGGVTPAILPLPGVTTMATADPLLVPAVDVLLGVDSKTELAKDGGQADSFVALLNEDEGQSMGGTNRERGNRDFIVRVMDPTRIYRV